MLALLSNPPSQWVERQPAAPNTCGYLLMAYSELSAPILDPMMSVLSRSGSVANRPSMAGFSSSTMKRRYRCRRRRHGGRCVLCGGGERREDRRERRAERAEYQNAMTHDCAPALNLTPPPVNEYVCTH